jgi:GntR family transcriptional repressor for pyruvate dehydrogenase complex
VASRFLDQRPDPIGRTIVRNEIINRVLRLIRLNRMAPGERLPSEPAWAKMLGVSRPSLREAMTVLETVGAIEIKRGLGTFVKDPGAATMDVSRQKPVAPAADDMERLAPILHKVRLAVEPMAAALAAERATDTDLRLMEIELDRLRSAALKRDVIEAAAADVAFHQAVLEGGHSPVLGVIISSLERPLRKFRELTIGGFWDDVYVVATHTKIFHAIRHRLPRAAEAAMRGHLEDIDKLVQRGSGRARRPRRGARPTSARGQRATVRSG